MTPVSCLILLHEQLEEKKNTALFGKKAKKNISFTSSILEDILLFSIKVRFRERNLERKTAVSPQYLSSSKIIPDHYTRQAFNYVYHKGCVFPPIQI